MSRLLSVFALMLALFLGGGCGDFSAFDEGWDRPAAYQNDQIKEAERSLVRHDIRGAQRAYAEAIKDDVASVRATAAAGKALTDLMLLLGEPAARALLTEHLGAERKNYDVQALIWSNEGLLYWFGTGARWADERDYSGVRSAVSELLPWSVTRLDSPEAFFKSLDAPVNGLMDQSVKVADALAQVQLELEQAINSGEYEYLYVPSEVFHDPNLTLILTKNDLLALHSALSLVRAGIYYIAAYDHSWTLSRALTQAPWEAIMADPSHPEHDAALTSTEQYAARYINASFMRKVRSGARLETSKQALVSSLTMLSRSIREVEPQLADATLRWDRLTSEDREALVELLNALERSTREPTLIPGSTPPLTLHLGRLFEQRTLAPEHDWLIEREERTQDELGQEVVETFIELNPDALEQFTGEFSSPSLWDREGSIGVFDDGTLERVSEDVLSPLSNRVQDAYQLY